MLEKCGPKGVSQLTLPFLPHFKACSVQLYVETNKYYQWKGGWEGGIGCDNHFHENFPSPIAINCFASWGQSPSPEIFIGAQ